MFRNEEQERRLHNLERQLKALQDQVTKLTAAHDSVTDWVAKELGLCVRKEYTFGSFASPIMQVPLSPRTFAEVAAVAVPPQLERCPTHKRKRGKK